MPNWTTEHWHARKIKGPGPCETCGAMKSEVHHVNGDWRDHRLENLRRLCRSCHNLVHDRAKRCVICGTKQKGLGYCEKHYQRFKKWGDPLKVGWPTRGMCQMCDRPHHAKGLCLNHYMAERRSGASPPPNVKDCKDGPMAGRSRSNGVASGTATA